MWRRPRSSSRKRPPTPRGPRCHAGRTRALRARAQPARQRSAFWLWDTGSASRSLRPAAEAAPHPPLASESLFASGLAACGDQALARLAPGRRLWQRFAPFAARRFAPLRELREALPPARRAISEAYRPTAYRRLQRLGHSWRYGRSAASRPVRLHLPFPA